MFCFVITSKHPVGTSSSDAAAALQLDPGEQRRSPADEAPSARSAAKRHRPAETALSAAQATGTLTEKRFLFLAAV